jgi:hypothetical protein
MSDLIGSATLLIVWLVDVKHSSSVAPSPTPNFFQPSHFSISIAIFPSYRSIRNN